MGPQLWELRKREYPAGGIDVAFDASMGPQQGELRKRPCKRLRCSCQQGFNGAAALVAAETRRAWPTITNISCFKGAAALVAAETSKAIPQANLASSLQWGRSFGSCGNRATGRYEGHGAVASMGPQLW